VVCEVRFNIGFGVVVLCYYCDGVTSDGNLICVGMILVIILLMLRYYFQPWKIKLKSLQIVIGCFYKWISKWAKIVMLKKINGQ
jgi:hypothetical protein